MLTDTALRCWFFKFRSVCVHIAVLFWLAAVSGSSSAQNSFAIVTKDLPRVLYHWVELEKLNDELADQLKRNSQLPMSTLKPWHLLGDSFPSLVNIPSLYVWNHPITSMATGPEEISGDVVIKIRTTPGPKRILSLISMDGEPPSKDLFNPDQYDAIYHRHYTSVKDGAELVFEEFVLTNPNTIDDFTADPRLLRRAIKEQIRNLKDPKFVYRQHQLYFKFPGLGTGSKPIFNSKYSRHEMLIPMLEEYLTKTPEDFDPVWLRQMNTSLCQDYAEHIGG